MGARSATRENNFDMYYRNARTLTLHDPVDKHRETAGRLQLGELDAK
jgi:alkylation response protein AidB-like acyl-CoA dehydrogenase